MERMEVRNYSTILHEFPNNFLIIQSNYTSDFQLLNKFIIFGTGIAFLLNGI